MFPTVLSRVGPDIRPFSISGRLPHIETIWIIVIRLSGNLPDIELWPNIQPDTGYLNYPDTGYLVSGQTLVLSSIKQWEALYSAYKKFRHAM